MRHLFNISIQFNYFHSYFGHLLLFSEENRSFFGVNLLSVAKMLVTIEISSTIISKSNYQENIRGYMPRVCVRYLFNEFHGNFRMVSFTIVSGGDISLTNALFTYFYYS